MLPHRSFLVIKYGSSKSFLTRLLSGSCIYYALAVTLGNFKSAYEKTWKIITLLQSSDKQESGLVVTL